jgi:hypothetical protein
VKGVGNQQDYGMRIYDPRIGKFLSVDPITSKYPELTPYQFASNRPIDGIDLDGLEFFKKDNTNYQIAYKPVLNAPNVLTGAGNAAHNALSFVWNGTLGAVMEGSKRINNYLAGGYKDREQNPDPVYAFMEGTNSIFRYHKETPVKQQLKDLGSATMDLRNYEIVPSLALSYGFSSAGFLKKPSLLMASESEAAPGSINYMRNNDQFAINAANAEAKEGFLDVIGHGDPYSFQVNNITKAGGSMDINHRILAKLMEKRPEFYGQKIRLMSCSTGEANFAKNLANKLGVTVEAPNNTLWAWPSGRLGIGPDQYNLTGKWIPFDAGIKK